MLTRENDALIGQGLNIGAKILGGRPHDLERSFKGGSIHIVDHHEDDVRLARRKERTEETDGGKSASSRKADNCREDQTGHWIMRSEYVKVY